MEDGAPEFDGTVLFASLPEKEVLSKDIFALLPADARGRAATVCTLWRHVLAQPDAWLALDVSASSGVAVALRTEMLLRSASARAGGGLITLDASGVAFSPLVPGRAFTTLLELAAANATLRTMSNPLSMFSAEELGALLNAAPALNELHADVCDSVAALIPLLRRELPNSAALRLSRICVFPLQEDAEVFALAATLSAFGGCRSVRLEAEVGGDGDFRMGRAALDAFLNSVLGSIEALTIDCCGLTPEHVPSLTRLLRDGHALRELRVSSRNQQRR